MSYADFIRAKQHSGSDSGFKPLWLPDFLFDFQAVKTEWNIRKGPSAHPGPPS